LVENIVADTDDETCALLDQKPDYLSRIYNGTKPFPKRGATFVLGHLDKEKFVDYLQELTDDGIEGIRSTFVENGIEIPNKYEVPSKCAEIFEEILNECAKKTRSTHLQPTKKVKTADPFEALKSAEALLASIPAPTQVVPPDTLLPEEQPYISELYAAYGDREGVVDFGEEHLLQYGDGEYDDDIKDRRIDYFAAESIRRGVSELYSGKYANQFELLKDETLDGIKNTARKTFPNGFERMLGVMEQAALIQVKRYILSQSPNWISNRIKMGVCHFLVNDNKLKWVKK
jgi:hypothetical protein